MDQTVIKEPQAKEQLDALLKREKINSIFLVCGKSLQKGSWGSYFSDLEARLGIRVVSFHDFEVNPSYSSVLRGLDAFRNSGCNLIIAAGGGSAIDVAKCIRLYSENTVPFYVLPTTAGSGSEATQFAVIYENGEKKSVSGSSCIPSVVIHDPDVLLTLPLKQKTATVLDAMCHSVESLWSVGSTDESTRYAAEALTVLWKMADSYLEEDKSVYAAIQQAAYLAGRAINISRTTAGHAMCYKLTTMYGLPHGAAAALCTDVLWKLMFDPDVVCIDQRGKVHLEESLGKIASSMGFREPQAAQEAFGLRLRKWLPGRERKLSEEDMQYLSGSVNAERLGNHPVKLSREMIRCLYQQIRL